jgi:hypothetical protein
MKDNYGQHGWKEFHRNRKDILGEFDKILEQIQNRPIQVAHGIGVEAFIRKWLAEFLPKKFGVTSGYIIPNLYNDSGKLYHYDIIIYNRLDSPILWVEGNQDDSEQGKFRAIPAKHVLALYEVKSRLKKENVIDSIKKLNQTSGFKEQLNPLYHCGMIFIDLKEKQNNDESIIKELFKGKDVFGFTGGVVLRYEGDTTCTGLINLHSLNPKEKSDNKEKNVKLKPLAKPIDELRIYYTEEDNLTLDEQFAGIKLVKTGENTWSFTKTYGTMYEDDYISIHLSWSRSNFSDFCMKLLSSLDGIAFNDENRPIFGQIFDTAERKKAKLQSPEKEPEKPFLKLKIYEGEDKDKQLKLSQQGKEGIISFWLVVENWGDYEVTFSDDYFKNKLTLPKGKYAMKKLSLKIELKDESLKIEDVIKEKFKIPYRLVYYVETENDSNKEFTSIEKEIVYKDDLFKFKE